MSDLNKFEQLTSRMVKVIERMAAMDEQLDDLVTGEALDAAVNDIVDRCEFDEYAVRRFLAEEVRRLVQASPE